MTVATFDPPSPFDPQDRWDRFEREIESMIREASEEDAQRLRELLRQARETRRNANAFDR